MSDLKSEIPVFYQRDTREIVDIRLDTISTEASLIEIIKGNNLVFQTKLVPDSLLLTTSDISRTIDTVIADWQKNYWKMNIPKDVMLNTLLPYKVLHERPQDWRSYFSKYFTGYLPQIKPTRPYSKIALDGMIADSVVWRDSTHTLIPRSNQIQLTRQPGLDELRIIKSGDCNSMAVKSTYLYRSFGIPATVDFTSQYGGGNTGHATAVFWDDSARTFRPRHGDGEGFNPKYKLSKAFRLSFKKQNVWKDSILPVVKKSWQFELAHLKNNHWNDVTDEHVPTSDIPVKAAGVQFDYAYLCTYTDGKWVPVYWAKKQNNQFLFRKMGREILYQFALPDNKGYRLTGQIILLDSMGGIQQTIRPDRKKVKKLELKKINYGRLAWVKKGSPYTLKFLNELGNWETFAKQTASRDSSIIFNKVPGNTFYLLVKNDERPLERPFTYNKSLVWY
ncbi:hypothetical protein LXM25_16500 [Dyadobacter sp. LJ53]|uniref:hypothetical protein n=1 Tax=Dyadobacter chenwenxiniae TaxID=2906456 RepID=UPI001F1A84B7|nr:hypothetical protein [Dyadobacter chenwenxiniae]MCF0051671.1 hypothetical protein [Dyadobacter chenwenxiniae]